MTPERLTPSSSKPESARSGGTAVDRVSARLRARGEGRQSRPRRTGHSHSGNGASTCTPGSSITVPVSRPSRHSARLWPTSPILGWFEALPDRRPHRDRQQQRRANHPADSLNRKNALSQGTTLGPRTGQPSPRSLKLANSMLLIRRST